MAKKKEMPTAKAPEAAEPEGDAMLTLPRGTQIVRGIWSGAGTNITTIEALEASGMSQADFDRHVASGAITVPAPRADTKG